MSRRSLRSTRTDTLLPYRTRFRSSVPILFDSAGQVVNVGRDQRLFTARQRIALSARDGGCIWPGCDRPPSWCEAHHIDEWQRAEEHTSELQSLMRTSYAVFCLKKKNNNKQTNTIHQTIIVHI